VPPPIWFDVVFDEFRRVFGGKIIGAGTVIWIGLLVLYLAWSRWRPLIAEVMLATAILVVVVWTMERRYVFAGGWIDNYQRLAWAGMACVVSVLLFMVRGKPRPPGTPQPCPTCQYDLTGNLSGCCPECGEPIPDSIRSNLAARS
jgi:hypothetical protein